MTFLTKLNSKNHIPSILKSANRTGFKVLYDNYRFTDSTVLYLSEPLIYPSEVLNFNAFPISEAEFIRKVATFSNRYQKRIKLLSEIREKLPLSTYVESKTHFWKFIKDVYKKWGVSTHIIEKESGILTLVPNAIMIYGAEFQTEKLINFMEFKKILKM